MPTHSQTDTIPAFHRDPAVQVHSSGRSGQNNPHDTIEGWNSRTPDLYMNFVPVKPVQLHAPTQTVMIPNDLAVWSATSARAEEVWLANRRWRSNPNNRPARLQMGYPWWNPNPANPVKQFLFGR